MSRKEQQQLMKTYRKHAELDLIKGRQTWPVRFMLVDLTMVKVSGFSNMVNGPFNTRIK